MLPWHVMNFLYEFSYSLDHESLGYLAQKVQALCQTMCAYCCDKTVGLLPNTAYYSPDK